MNSIFGDVSPNAPVVSELSLSSISPDPQQARKFFDEESIEELARTIDKHGLIQPIIVRTNPDGEGYLLIAGERRLRAMTQLGWEKAPAIVQDKIDPAAAALIENIQREDLSPFEEADAIRELMQTHGLNQRKVSELVGKKRNTVNQLLNIQRLPKDVREDAIEQRTPRSILIELAQIGDAATIHELWSKNERLTVAMLRRKAAAKKRIRPESGTTRALNPTKVLQSAAKHIASLEGARLTDEQREEARALIAVLEGIVNSRE